MSRLLGVGRIGSVAVTVHVPDDEHPHAAEPSRGGLSTFFPSAVSYRAAAGGTTNTHHHEENQ